MRKIFIEAGHHSADPGAVNMRLGVREAALTMELRDLVTAKLRALDFKGVIVHDVEVENLAATIRRKQLRAKAEDLLLSIHFNAHSRVSAGGTEVIVKNGEVAPVMAIAGELSRRVAGCLGIANRGVKTEAQSARGRLGILHLRARSLLLEVCFISNDGELNIYLEKREEVAEVIAKCLLEFL